MGKVEKLKEGKDRDFVMTSLNQLGIPCYSGSCSEIYKEKAFDQIFSNQRPNLPNAQELGETSLMFLVHPTINDNDIDKIVDQTTKILEKSIR